MKKKLLGVLLCATMAAGMLAGCGSGKTDSTGETSGKEGGDKVLTLWSIATESDSFNHAYTQAIADFEAANPGVKIKHETFENQSYKTKIKSAVAANEMPDLFYTWGGGFSSSFVEAGKVLELDEYFTEEYEKQLPQTARAYATYNDKLYGSTFTTPISALFYNKVIFEENNIKVPTNWDELITACKALKAKGITPFGVSAKDTWVLAMCHDGLVLKSAGPEKTAKALTKQGQSYNDPDFLNASSKLKELVDMGAFLDGATGLSNDEASASFYNGSAAMYITGSWMGGAIQLNAEKPENFDAVPFPVISDNAKITDYMGGAVDTIMVNSATKDKELAAKAVFELTKSISKYAYLDGAGIAAWEIDYDDSSVNTITKNIADYASKATSFTIWFDTLMAAEDAGEYLALLQELYIGNMSPQEFVEAMDQQLSK